MRGLRKLSILLVGALTVTVGLSPGSAVTAPETIQPPPPALEKQLKDWLVAWQPVLQLRQFRRISGGPIGKPWRTVTMDLSPRHPGFPVFVLSPDGRWFVDVLGGLTMTRQNGNVEVGLQPDSWVYLGDRKKPRIRQILMTGTAGGFQEAVWLSNDTFAIAGYGQWQPKQSCSRGYTWVPLIWMINLPKNSITAYRGTESCVGISNEYTIKKIKQKIPNVTF